ncbi:hypothetical protein M427DRAFT_58909 [Gonapodya prolifera JEL478]|uniref:Uncharacterized protein n=1 Tax=Gonapodya prolifera (strain JEL478) TaxID=1344416 RepID=A0A139A9V5_GONPJ|nr:hypothetical protein M427DRAFT_58909 [Gonapodya prolifera JEL478]|eukprot:KXS13193.1 hypothetical protein M427DRAFT_58909 [Gonapodya prolifera JEL478]
MKPSTQNLLGYHTCTVFPDGKDVVGVSVTGWKTPRIHVGKITPCEFLTIRSGYSPPEPHSSSTGPMSASGPTGAETVTKVSGSLCVVDSSCPSDISMPSSARPSSLANEAFTLANRVGPLPVPLSAVVAVNRKSSASPTGRPDAAYFTT